MKFIEMICLAVSRKIGGKCIAGINVGSKKWIRLVSPSGGPLTDRKIRFENGHLCKVLDKIRVAMVAPMPLDCQPENHIVNTGLLWEKYGEYSARNLDKFCYTGPYIFHDNSDRLTPSECASMQNPHSLVLVKPLNTTFEVRHKLNRPGIQARANFEFNGYSYDLVVTDSEWEREILRRGSYEPNNDFYFTISLGGRFERDDCHYKLVAGIIPING